jgi:hypothetical protein
MRPAGELLESHRGQELGQKPGTGLAASCPLPGPFLTHPPTQLHATLTLSGPCLCALSVQRPVIHPLSSPSNRFCVTSLDPDTLPAVATLLMDVMFYSNG